MRLRFSAVETLKFDSHYPELMNDTLGIKSQNKNRLCLSESMNAVVSRKHRTVISDEDPSLMFELLLIRKLAKKFTGTKQLTFLQAYIMTPYKNDSYKFYVITGLQSNLCDLYRKLK